VRQTPRRFSQPANIKFKIKFYLFFVPVWLFGLLLDFVTSVAQLNPLKIMVYPSKVIDEIIPFPSF
jgi:hypothetical protein